MLKYLLVVVTIFMLAKNTVGQKIIYGKVSDGISHEFLPYVNVFVNNSTLGTVTDKDGEYTLIIPTGQHEVIFSFVGYQSNKVISSSSVPDTVRIDMKLFPAKQELDIIEVRGSRDNEWQKRIKQFQNFFLGNTSAAAYCTIRNAWCVDLRKEKISGKQVLVGSGSQPLEIENLALGYKIFYDLQNFTASKEIGKYSGNVYFAELEPKDSNEAEVWAQNRRNAYRGSSRHLFKSILDKRVEEEGFTLFTYQILVDKIQRMVYNQLRIEFDSLKRTYKILMENKIIVHYGTSTPSNTTLVAGMDFTNGYVEVDEHGVVMDPLSVVTSGYISDLRVANLLPDDYQPTVQSDFTTRPASVQVTKPDRIQESNAITGAIKNVEPAPIPVLARLDSLEKKAEYYSKNHPTEKVYIHFDKPFYLLGEDRWYNAYVVSGSDLSPTDISTVLHLDWIGPAGKIVKHQRLKIENGRATGDFAIDTTFHEGMYTVRAYTNWMRNEDPGLFYTKKIQVFNPRASPSALRNDTLKHKIDLQFFPEGGTLVEGIQTQIAFKAIDGNGKGIGVKGQIVDEQNRIVTTFQSTHGGMGIFPLVGDTRKSFRAILQQGEVYALPSPSKSGLTLAVSNMNSSKILVRIQSTKNDEPSIYLIGHSRGAICYAASIKMDSPSKDISILKDELPEGILQLTLFNSEGIPQCERMLFIPKDGDRMEVSIHSDKEQYAPRDSIMLNFKVNDLSGDPVETSLSVSVTDASFIGADLNSENIYTQLLLQSDLRGNVENPGWYFESQTTEKRYALDLVMLTHGWSRYNWKKILDPSTDSISFMPENGITLQGQILANGKPVANAPFTLMIPQSGNDFVNIYESDSLGYFSVPGLNFGDSTMFSWRVMSGRKGRVQNAKIQLDTTLNIPPVSQYGGQYLIPTESKNELFDKLQTRFLRTGVWSLENTIMLEEVVVKGERIKITNVGAGAIAVKPGPDDLKAGTSQFVNRNALGLPAAKLVRISDEKEIWTTAAGGPILISINGYISEATGFAANPFIVLNSIPIEQIEYVVIAGDPHNGYFIDVGTSNTIINEGFGTIKQLVNGYDAAREFYHPKYGPLDISTTMTDNRMTLYWNANLQTNKDGTATAKFYNTDSTQELLITVEGIANGVAISTKRILGKAD